MSRSWEELVAEGRHLVEELTNDKFALGDLINEAVTLRQGKRTSHDVVKSAGDDSTSLHEFAEAVGLSYRQASGYRATASAWPKDHRHYRVSFGVYEELASRDERINVIHDGMTVDEARQVKGNKPKNELAPKTVAEKREALRELAEDPDVVDEVVEAVSDNPKLTAQVNERAAEKRPAPRKKVRETSDMDLAAHLGVGYVIAHAIDKNEESIDVVVGWLRENDADDATIRAVVEDIRKLRASGDRLHMYAEEMQVALDGGVSDERIRQFTDGGL